VLNSKAVSLSFAVTMEIFYLVCAFFSYLFPNVILLLFNTWAHSIDLTKIASTKPPMFTDFFIGFISIFVFSYITGAIFTGIYNAVVKRIG